MARLGRGEAVTLLGSVDVIFPMQSLGNAVCSDGSNMGTVRATVLWWLWPASLTSRECSSLALVLCLFSCAVINTRICLVFSGGREQKQIKSAKAGSLGVQPPLEFDING